MEHNHHSSSESKSCCTIKKRTDWILWISGIVILAAYVGYFVLPDNLVLLPAMTEFMQSVVQLVHKMWWGVALGILFVGILAGIPQSLVMSVLGRGGTVNGILRATLSGVLLDICSHGVLLVGMQLYKRGASLGQMMAFLIASPWNSLSLTLVIWALVGLQWTLLIVALSLILAVISGLLFDQLVKNGVLPSNPHVREEEEGKGIKTELQEYVRSSDWWGMHVLWAGIKESRMILRWITFGIVLAALIRALVPTELFAQVFGPTLLGLGATLVFATVLEVCSEGSMPVAADFLLRAKAPGNMFAFLMAGVSTDYTEIISIKETTGKWKVALFLPLVTLPQVVAIAILLNIYGGS